MHKKQTKKRQTFGNNRNTEIRLFFKQKRTEEQTVKIHRTHTHTQCVRHPIKGTCERGRRSERATLRESRDVIVFFCFFFTNLCDCVHAALAVGEDGNQNCARAAVTFPPMDASSRGAVEEVI